jgi:hypothetical protein
VKISKAKDTFNDYKVELSWGQLNAIYNALEQNHADPLADELFAELGWYLQNVPGPGEDEEEYKAAKEAEKQAREGGEAVPSEADPELVGQEVDGPPEGEAGAFGAEGGPEGAESPVPEEEADVPEEADQLLERPPTSPRGE